MSEDPRTAGFLTHRRMLFGIAYRMLGSVADAEDIVQDAFLRWQDVSVPVANPAAYLSRTVTNLALNRIRDTAASRASYVGPWLPEPLLTGPDSADDVERAETVSLAMLVVLESLSPLERAVFVLKEVFCFSYNEIAEMLDRSEPAVRQVGHRAREHVTARRPRFDPPADAHRVVEEFLAACLGGDLNRMLEHLAPDVTAWTDGGGKVKAALRPLHGAENVVRWLLGVLARSPGPVTARVVEVNGGPGLLGLIGGAVDSVACLDVVDGRIVALRLVRNPDKLSGVTPRPA